LVRFGAFDIVRIPQMKFLGLGLSYTLNDRTYTRVKTLASSPKLKEGEILLNSRAIHHTATWDELHDISVRYWEIDSKCETTEVGEYGILPDDAKKIDEVGYQTRKELYHKGIQGNVPSIDSMIRDARKNMAEQERMIQEARRRERNTQATIAKIAELLGKDGQQSGGSKKDTEKDSTNNGAQSITPSNTQNNVQGDVQSNAFPATPSNNSRGRRGRSRCRGYGGRGRGDAGRGGFAGGNANSPASNNKGVVTNNTNKASARGNVGDAEDE
jgi:hypothetical protein